MLKVFDKEAREIISSTATKNVNIVDKIKTKMDETYSNVVSCLQFAALCIKADPTQAFNILTKIYTLILSLPAKKIMKFVIKKLTKNVLSLISNKYSSDVLRALFFMFQEIIFRYNSYTNISATTKPKFYEFDLLEVNSDIFSKIKFKDLVAHNSSHLQLHEKLSENFLSYNEQKGLIIKQVRSLFSIRHFIREFNSAHKDIMIFIYRNLSLFLANMIDPFEMIIFLRENFNILQTSIEFLRDENIFAIISVHFSVLNLLKNSPLPNIERRFLQKFYSKSLKFALSYFAKNTRFYVDETFESQHKILKIEKKMDLALKACRYLKFETFMETTLTSEKIDCPIKFPPVFIDLNVTTPSKTKLLFKFKETRSFCFFSKLKSRSVGSLGYSKLKKNISVIYDPSNEKKQILPNITGLNRYQNLRKLLLLLIGHETDAIKAFNKTELGLIKYEFTLEDKVINENEAKQLLYFAFDINIHLAVYIIRRLAFAFPSPFTTPQVLIRDLVTKYYLFNFSYQILFDYFIEKNLQSILTLRNLFYWETPQFPLLMKYMTLEYEGQKTLSIHFTKTVKRLESTQLLFYLPQIYQTLNTEESYLVAQTLKEYSQTSYLFSHQLIWKAKVESKREKNETGNSKLAYISWQLLYQLLKGLNRTEKFLFKQVDDFFEAVTAISGILQPKMPKKQKEEIIQAELEKIIVSEYLYVPSNPQYIISKIKLDSGRAMQSAAKCPILVSFYCKRFEGPDKYYPKLLNKNVVEPNVKDSEEDLPIDNENYPSINDLKLSGKIKLLPKESLLSSVNNLNKHGKSESLE